MSITHTRAPPQRIGAAPGDGFLVTLLQVKQYLRIEHNGEDALLGDILIPAAEDYCVWYTRRPVEQCATYPSVKQAALLVVGANYLNREQHVQGQAFQTNPAADALLWAHRDLCGDFADDWLQINPLYCPDYSTPWTSSPSSSTCTSS